MPATAAAAAAAAGISNFAAAVATAAVKLHCGSASQQIRLAANNYFTRDWWTRVRFWGSSRGECISHSEIYTYIHIYIYIYIYIYANEICVIITVRLCDYDGGAHSSYERRNQHVSIECSCVLIMGALVSKTENCFNIE